jgi:transcriptional regulator with XRE-family HTH domain
LRKFNKKFSQLNEGNKMTFYENYQRLCSKMGKSTSKVAEEIGFNKASASGWKRGAVPSGSNLQKIADYFGVSADYLLTGEEPTYQALRSSDEEVEIFEAINALKDTELRRLVLRLSKASQEEIRKVHGFLDLTQIGGSYGS